VRCDAAFMTQLAQEHVEFAHAPQTVAIGMGIARSRALAMPFVAAAGLCALSWTLGGVPLITDLGMLVLAGAAAVLFVNELAKFPRRFGIGGLVLFGGILIWFCDD